MSTDFQPLDFNIEDMFIDMRKTQRLDYASNSYTTNNLISWRSRCYALGLILFLIIYGINHNTCLVIGTINTFVSAVAPLFPKMNFIVHGGKVQESVNVKYKGEDITDLDAQDYEDQYGADLLLFININRNEYWKKRKEELELRSLTEDDITAENIATPKYFLIEEALLQAAIRCDEQVEKDMITQYKLFTNIKHSHAFMRFRLPFNTNDRAQMEYLKGVVYFPVWGKGICRETWIKPVMENGVYKISNWSLYDYETYIYNHNIISRQNNMYNNIFSGLPEFNLGNELLNDFDGSAETLIFARYLELYGTPNYENVKKLSLKLTEDLNKISGVDNTLAKLRNRGCINDPFV